nr:uncharacterized protein CTRU02_14214 [Colletotrichum truncatum]KAF6782437.1 hypothetical protein CTRU02_14214 [Colletotrichum truncatum]
MGYFSSDGTRLAKKSPKKQEKKIEKKDVERLKDEKKLAAPKEASIQKKETKNLAAKKTIHLMRPVM